jgi:hypothetical protein
MKGNPLASLADEVHDAPAAVARLNMFERKRRDFGPPKPAAQEDREDRPVAQALIGGGIWRVQKRLACLAVSQLPRRRPLEATPLTRVTVQRPVIGGLDGQLPYRRDPRVDRDCAQSAGF